MRRWLLVGGIAFALVAVAVVLMGGPGQSVRSVRDARALAGLPQAAVAPMLRLEEGAPDVVVFEDGDAGWFELDPSALPPDLEIGIHGPRMIDILGGGSHVPVYCGGSGRRGKVLWAVRGGQIADDFAFCNPRRMDLGPLRPFAAAVEMINEDLSRADLLALTQDITSDPARAVISGPVAMTEFTHRYVITPPEMWYIQGQPPFQHEVERQIEAQMTAHLGAVQLTFRPRPLTNPNLSYTDPPVSGMAIRHGDEFAIVPDVRGAPTEIWIDCLADSCARVATLAFDGMFDAARDVAGLRAAMGRLVENPVETSSTPLDWFPTLADLEATQTTVAAPIPVTYPLRYIIRSQSE